MKTLFGEIDVSSRLITSTPLAFAFPAKMPIIPGHILVCSKRCVEKIEELNAEEIEALFSLVVDIKKALAETFGATGFNVAWNEGEVAGQTVPHLHIHIVPRSVNDKGIVEYEPRKFLYRPGLRAASPEEELSAVAQALSKRFN